MSGQIYEYLCVDIGGREAEGRTELLNEYADEGWELVTAGVWWAYFRRVSVDGLFVMMEEIKEMAGGYKGEVE